MGDETMSGMSISMSQTDNTRPKAKKGLEVLTALDEAKTRWYHFTAVIIAGMGFFTDAYDLFCIASVSKLLGRLYYYHPASGKPGVLPPDVQFWLTGVALIGTLIGQLFFGLMGDKFGRKKVYGMTLILMVLSSVGSSLSFGHNSGAVLATICFFRFWLGFGIGGDYPLSATIMSEYANTRTRGSFIAAVFAMQGVGLLVAATFALTVCAIFGVAFPDTVGKAPKFIDDHVHSTPREADYIWRLVFAFGAIPAGLTYYWRMKMPETARYTALVEGNVKQAAADMAKVLEIDFGTEIAKEEPKQQGEQFGLWSREFTRRHGWHLLGTTMCWFLLDIAFYSQNLFSKDVFQSVGWIPPARQMNAVEEVYRIAAANAKLACMSTVPGYIVTVLLIDRIGRFAIQLQGFFFMTVFMAAAAIPYGVLKKKSCPIPGNPDRLCGGHVGLFIALYGLTFFFANFGPNSTTFIVPAEIFPARLRSTCHGISAGAGKFGAIVGSFGFYVLAQGHYPDAGYQQHMGPRKALMLMAVVNFLGFCFTFFVPETNQRSLEDLSRENEEVDPVPALKEVSDASAAQRRRTKQDV